MLGKRSRPMTIGKLAGVLRSSGIIDSTSSPRSPLDCKMSSPRGLKSYDQGGVGLGIVVALNKSSNAYSGGEILAKYAITNQYSSRGSNPIPVISLGKCNNNKDNNTTMIDIESLDEEYTFVTCHGPDKSTTTRVYYDGGDFGSTKRCNKIDLRDGVAQNFSVFNISPARVLDDRCTISEFGSGSDFLSSCHLCRKNLHGKDIYMYRGEKAFCSSECRQRQIGIDERKDKCRSEASRTGSLSSSPCSYTNRGQIFSTGIVAI